MDVSVLRDCDYSGQHVHAGAICRKDTGLGIRNGNVRTESRYPCKLEQMGCDSYLHYFGNYSRILYLFLVKQCLYTNTAFRILINNSIKITKIKTLHTFLIGIITTAVIALLPASCSDTDDYFGERVDTLVAQMILKEKINMLSTTVRTCVAFMYFRKP
jgi:hypothetical protein